MASLRPAAWPGICRRTSASACWRPTRRRTFATLSEFRKQHLAALGDLFLQVLALCQRAGLVKLGHVALDGTKVKANSSKHHAMSFGRMQQKRARLQQEVAAILRQAAEVDAAEDRQYGATQRGDEWPAELAFREDRLRKIEEAMAAMAAEAQAAAEQAEEEGGTHPGVPPDKSHRNFTDPESRIMPMAGGKDFEQAYNCQAVVDGAHQVIAAGRATAQSWDKPQAVPMIKETIHNLGAVPRQVSAVAGYYSAQAVDLCGLGVDPFIAADKTRHNAENLSEAVAESARALQRFLIDARWDDGLVIGRLQADLGARLTHAQAVWVLDGSDFPKQGLKSVAVARQYCGSLGKIANWQAGLFLAHVGPQGRALVDKRLYLPAAWCVDAHRCDAAHVPAAQRRYQAKTDLALEMLVQAQARGHLGAPWVAADAAFGMSPSFREGVAAAGLGYVLDVSPQMTVWPRAPTWTDPPNQGFGRPRTPKLRRGQRRTVAAWPCRQTRGRS